MDFKDILQDFAEQLKASFLHLVYPSTCLHCKALLIPSSLVLCSSCASLLKLASLYDRCPVCFNLIEDEYSIPCKECAHFPSPYKRMASAFDYDGPAASLIKRLKYSNQPYLANGMAGFLVTQFDRLQWPIPDALIPVPISFTHRMERGYNQSALLAKEMGALLKRPVWDILRRQSGDYSQAALNFDQRRGLEVKNFKMKLNCPLEGKMLLVVDDVMTSGSTLRRCAEVLQEQHPGSLYALTFCRTILPMF